MSPDSIYMIGIIILIVTGVFSLFFLLGFNLYKKKINKELDDDYGRY